MTDSKVAIVTGAANGVGAATARRLAGDGWEVVAADVACDVAKLATEHSAITSIVVDLTEEVGNQAVLNAGISVRGSIGSISIADLDRAWAINARALVLGVQTALPALRRSRGAVSVTCSVSGLFADPAQVAYNTSKGAAVNFVRAAAMDLGPEGVRVNGVCPGPIAGTGMTAAFEHREPELFDEIRSHVPLQRWGHPEEIAAVHAFLLSDDASFVTGALLPVDGGVTCGTGQFTPNPG